MADLVPLCSCLVVSFPKVRYTHTQRSKDISRNTCSGIAIQSVTLSFDDLFILGHVTWLLFPVIDSKNNTARQYHWSVITNITELQPPQRFFTSLSTAFVGESNEFAVLFGGENGH